MSNIETPMAALESLEKRMEQIVYEFESLGGIMVVGMAIHDDLTQEAEARVIYSRNTFAALGLAETATSIIRKNIVLAKD